MHFGYGLILFLINKDQVSLLVCICIKYIYIGLCAYRKWGKSLVICWVGGFRSYLVLFG